MVSYAVVTYHGEAAWKTGTFVLADSAGIGDTRTASSVVSAVVGEVWLWLAMDADACSMQGLLGC